ncbi:hypothetical protein [Zavarzinia sp. CC-PAN008]|uniref:hypothetical protein n=1 Tax=Zavarzinia sp. CC-PAN008 TaxID=3243332 RepID=UPI003F74714E
MAFSRLMTAAVALGIGLAVSGCETSMFGDSKPAAGAVPVAEAAPKPAEPAAQQSADNVAAITSAAMAASGPAPAATPEPAAEPAKPALPPTFRTASGKVFPTMPQPRPATLTDANPPASGAQVAAATVPPAAFVPPTGPRQPSAAAGTSAAIASAIPRPNRSCQSAKEAEADAVRHFQTVLMVAALKCHRMNPELKVTERYNDFVRRFSPVLVTHSNTLQAFFRKQHGRGFLRRFDNYVTVLAQEVSEESNKIPNYCQTMLPLVEQALATKPADFGKFSLTQAIPAQRPVAACK